MEQDLVPGEDGYVSEPASFHDAEVISFQHFGNFIDISVKNASTADGLRSLVIRCHRPHYTYLSTALLPGVIFGLWKFDRIWDESCELPIENGAQEELRAVRQLIGSNTSFVASQRRGCALWFEPSMENPLLVMCDKATVQFTA